MNHSKGSLFSRFFVLFIALTLSMPSHAWALREIQTGNSAIERGQLTAALTSGVEEGKAGQIELPDSLRSISSDQIDRLVDERLNPKQQQAFKMRYGRAPYDRTHSAKEIGQALGGLSLTRATQLWNEALGTLSRWVEIEEKARAEAGNPHRDLAIEELFEPPSVQEHFSKPIMVQTISALRRLGIRDSDHLRQQEWKVLRFDYHLSKNSIALIEFALQQRGWKLLRPNPYVVFGKNSPFSDKTQKLLRRLDARTDDAISDLTEDQIRESPGFEPATLSEIKGYLTGQGLSLREKAQSSGVEEGQVSRRGFLAAVAAMAGPVVRHLVGLSPADRLGELAADNDMSVANVERGRKETFIVNLNAPSAELPPLIRILVQAGATVPAVWANIPQKTLDADPAVAQGQLGELAQAGEIVLLAPTDDLTARSWDEFLRSKQLLGIETSAGLLSTLETLTPQEMALFLGSLGPAGGLILDAQLREEKAGTRELIVSA